jgi:lipopolysaccharide transport system permease protein
MELNELWAYRELIFFLTWRDIKVRYKQTAVGAAWALIQPLFIMLVFSLVFGRLEGFTAAGIPYPLFALAGILPWTLFATAVANSANSLVSNSALLTKVYFPRLIIPATPVVASLVDFAVAALLLAGLMTYYGVGVHWSFLALPGVVLALTLLALGAGTLLSAWNVKYRDVRHAVPFLIQFWMFASPVIYPPTLVPPRWRWLLTLNPLTGFLEAFRACLFGLPFPSLAFTWATALTLSTGWFALRVFRQTERTFADFA